MITCKFEDGGKGGLRHLVVHALAIKDGKILLVKRAQRIIEGGKWGLPGGFLDRDETLEECAIRELKEETGYEGKVKELLRINSNPNRRNDGGRQNVAFEIFVEAGEKTGEMDWEQTEVKWFDLDKLDLEDLAFDHATTIKYIKEHREKNIKLPIVE